MKKKFKKFFILLLTITTMFPMSVNAATYRYYLRSSSSSATYIDMTYTQTKDDIRLASRVAYKKLGQSLQISSSNPNMTNTSNTSVTGGTSKSEINTVSNQKNLSFTQTCTKVVATFSVPSSSSAGYYYICIHFPQYSCTYKKYIADSSGTKQQGSTTYIPDMQAKNSAYVTKEYSKTYPTFTC